MGLSGNSFKLTAAMAAKISASVDRWRGSRHSRTVRPDKKGSCGIIVIPCSRPRTSAKPSNDKSIPSNAMLPDSTSTRRKRVAVKEDLPAPVLPTTPTKELAGHENVRPFNASGRSGRYRMQTLSNSSFPVRGHSESRLVVEAVSQSASCGTSDMASTRSIAVMDASASPKKSTRKLRANVKFMDPVIRRPTNPELSSNTLFKQQTSNKGTNTIKAPIISIREPNHLCAET
mmetsp:Transcript_11584/g.23767  ORF Transcript_11584/g.23767 Transcript_11584/m.23767 type:complete len:231 (-) Transcript_11584:220-912(-)